MKRLFRLTALLLSLSLLLGLTACNEEQVIATSYKSLAVASKTYDAALLTAADLDRQGKLSVENKLKVIAIGNQFRDAFQVAGSALEAYAATTRADDKTKLYTAMAEVTRLVCELSTILQPYLATPAPEGLQS